MYYKIKPIISKEKYQHKRNALFNNEEFNKVLYWIANDVMQGEI